MLEMNFAVDKLFMKIKIFGKKIKECEHIYIPFETRTTEYRQSDFDESRHINFTFNRTQKIEQFVCQKCLQKKLY